MLQSYCTETFHFTQDAHNRECTVSCASYLDVGIYIEATWSFYFTPGNRFSKTCFYQMCYRTVHNIWLVIRLLLCIPFSPLFICVYQMVGDSIRELVVGNSFLNCWCDSDVRESTVELHITSCKCPGWAVQWGCLGRSTCFSRCMGDPGYVSTSLVTLYYCIVE